MISYLGSHVLGTVHGLDTQVTIATISYQTPVTVLIRCDSHEINSHDGVELPQVKNLS